VPLGCPAATHEHDEEQWNRSKLHRADIGTTGVDPQRFRSSYPRKRPKKEGEMQYMLLIYGDQDGWKSRSEEENGQIMQAYMQFTQELQDSGSMVAGDALEPTPTATTVRVRNDETLTTDGPFAETKEQLGGYYIVDVGSIDEALEWAAKIPGASHGSVEVRPVMVFEEDGSS
jgi:hypothetical protein